jgi:hypothetical protein
MLVALLVAHRSVADWPRSMVDGSATNVEIAGFAGCGLGGGGGGSGGGGCRRHPATIKNRENAIKMAVRLRLFIWNLPPGIMLDQLGYRKSYCVLHTGFSFSPSEVS